MTADVETQELVANVRPGRLPKDALDRAANSVTTSAVHSAAGPLPLALSAAGDLGVGASLGGSGERPAQRWTFAVDGMTCASCVARV